MSRGGAATMLAFRELRTRPVRALLTGLAVIVGVGLVSGALMYGDVVARARADEDLEQISRIVTLAGVVALVVGSFVISSTLSVTLTQRVRELALLRCAGATRTQVRRTLRVEAALVGLAGSVLGLALGFVVTAVLRVGASDGGAGRADLAEVPTALTPVAALVGCGLGLGAMVIASRGPARRAARGRPVAALRVTTASDDVRRGRTATAIIVGTAGVGGVVGGAATHQGPALLAGAVVTIIGLRTLGPRLLTATPGLRRLLAGVAGFPGELGLANARRSPDRTAGTVTAVVVGVTLLTAISVLSASTKAYILASGTYDPAETVRVVAMIDRSTRLYQTLSALATIVALVGVTIVLALSGVQRRREIGLLRAAGMLPHQVRTMVRAEAAVLAVVGVVLGTGIGLVVAWAAGVVLERSSAPTLFTVPWLTLAIIDGSVIAAAIVAATLPAWWVSRLDVVTAIGTE